MGCLKLSYYYPEKPVRRNARSGKKIVQGFVSVDPMASKYPHQSNYVYCANNPVKFIDPNGMEWETPEDKNKATSLIQKATKQKDIKQQTLNELKEIEKPTNSIKEQISNLKKEIEFLDKGIANITAMGEDNNETYHFQEVKGEGGVFKREDGVLNIEYSTDAMAWHETVHIEDSKNNPSEWSFNAQSYLATSDKNFAKSEIKAYQSQFSFDNNSLRYTNDTRVTKLSDVKYWVQFHKFDIR